MSYLFRWKDCGIEVAPSEAETEAEVWAWALKNLRGATETPAQARTNIRRNGEVIKVRPSKCPTCGSRYLDSVTKNYTILTGRTICTDKWHAGWQVPANNLDHEQVSTGDIIDKLDMDEPAKGAPIPGVIDDPLDALIANGREKALEYREIARVARKNRHDSVADHANGKATSLFLFLKELESIRADHDALVSRRAREEALGFLGALVDKWRDKAKILRHSDPLTANRGDGVSWCAGDLQAALANPESGNWLEQNIPPMGLQTREINVSAETDNIEAERPRQQAAPTHSCEYRKALENQGRPTSERRK